MMFGQIVPHNIVAGKLYKVENAFFGRKLENLSMPVYSQ